MSITDMLMVLDIFSAASGLLFALSRELWALTLTGILMCALIIALVLIPASRRVYRTKGAAVGL